MKYGLLANPKFHNWEGMYFDSGTFLALDASAAEDYADTSDNPPEETVVLKVKLSSLDDNKFKYDWNNRCEYHNDINSCLYMADIPSNLLSVCNVETEPSQEFDDFEGSYLYDVLYDTFWEECETNLEREED